MKRKNDLFYMYELLFLILYLNYVAKEEDVLNKVKI